MKRLLRVYAEVFDEDTGQVSVAPLAENVPWPPPLDAVGEARRGQPSSGASEEASAVESEAEEPSTEPPPVVEETEAEATRSTEAEAEVAAEVPESGDEPTVTPTYMTDLVEPEGEPAVSEEKNLAFEVDDDPAGLKLFWDDGVTEKNRRMHMAPFADGMWAVFENDGEYLVFLKRGRLKATEFEAQSSLKEAKGLASLLSKRWMGETQGDFLLQRLATTNARDFVRWVGLALRVDSDNYHFRRGRVRRQQTTVIVTYVGAKEEAGGRQRIEVRLTPTKSGSTLAVWALWYGLDGKISGSYFEPDLPRERLAELRGLQFGPAPGKRLLWEKVSEREERAEWGRHLLVLQRSRRLSLLILRRKDGDVFLHCGQPDFLKGVALNALVRYLRKHSRKEPAGGASVGGEAVEARSSQTTVATERVKAPEPEPEPAASERPAEPAPKVEERPAAEEEKAPPRLTKTMKAALAKLARAPAGEERAVFKGIHWKTRKGLSANGLVNKDGELTELGWELSDVAPPRRASKPNEPKRAPEPEPDVEVEDEDEDEDVDGVSAEQAQAIEAAMGSAVDDLTSRMPPLPAE